MPRRLVFLLGAAAMMASAQSRPRNLDFLEGAVGEEPAGWGHNPDYAG
jgi:hypothetical protein